MLKLKLAACYAGYIAVIIILFSRRFVGITQYKNGVTSGVLIFMALTFWVLYLTIHFMRKDAMVRLEALADNNNKKSLPAEDMLRDYVQYSNMAARQLDWRIRDETVRLGELASLMLAKLDTIDRLLLESFSRTDLAYIAYKDNIKAVTDEYLGNFKSVRTRIDAFDRNWQEKSSAAMTVESEMQEYLKKNEDILAQVDGLVISLIRLADGKGEESKNAMRRLLEDTESYAINKNRKKELE